MTRATERAAAVAVALIAAACGSKKPASGGPTASPADVDALWALAPQGATTGVVVSKNAMRSIDGVLARAEDVGKASPELAAQVADAEQRLAAGLHVPSLHRLADVGLATDRGFAIFKVGERSLAIVPVGDRAKLTAAMGASRDVTCRPVADRFECADDPKLFDAPRAAPAGRHATLHGDVELWTARAELAKGKVEVTGDLELAAVIGSGRFTLRAHVPIKATAELASFARAAHVKAPGADDAAGLLAIDLAPMIAKAPRGGLFDAIHAFAGPVTMVAMPGDLDLDVRAKVRDADAIRALLRRCDQLLPPEAGTLTPTADGCHVQPSPGIAGALVNPAFDVWLDGDTLRASRDRKTAVKRAVDVPPTEIGKELGDGSWTFAAWGRGALTRTMMPAGTPDAIYGVPFALVTELGVGARVGDDGIDGLLHVRTIFDDPDDVIAALAPVLAKVARGEPIDQDVAAVAAKFPSSPYAADVRSGEGGLMLPTALVGMLSAIVIPLELEYLNAPKGTEADLQLDNLGSLAKKYYYENNDAFPVGTVGLTPAADCCTQPGMQCAPSAADWSDPVWTALHFHMTDRPFRFRYAYQGTATEFTATATADLDCDATNGVTTITAHGHVVNGEPVVDVTRVDED